MIISGSAEYGLIAVAHIAQNCKDGAILAGRISKEYNISSVYLLKILHRLVNANILRSKRGQYGGFSLARPASEISMLEIIEAVDGPLAGNLFPADFVKNTSFGLKMESIHRKATKQKIGVYRKARLSEMISAF